MAPNSSLAASYNLYNIRGEEDLPVRRGRTGCTALVGRRKTAKQEKEGLPEVSFAMAGCELWRRSPELGGEAGSSGWKRTREEGKMELRLGFSTRYMCVFAKGKLGAGV